MIFSSLGFFAFMLVAFALLLIIRQDRGRKAVLLAGSYAFYGAWDMRFLALIFACSIWSWWLGLLMARQERAEYRRWILGLCLFLDLGMLGYFKYANFFIDSLQSLVGLDDVVPLDIVLPVGISFFTFQAMSYNIDLYRQRIPICRSLPKFLLFIAFFPQLVAGPIVRASEFLPQLNRPVRLEWANVNVGVQIFLIGLVQKSVFGDNLAVLVDPVFAHPNLYDTGTLWLGMFAYAGQIFCDFSGYSLMAIGVARMLSFDMPTNFRTPYLAGSITDFWRRWHITLSTWLRDYLYISLGGNRKGEVRTNVNLMITMLLGGLWHGASWNFVVWGSLHGLGLVAHKQWVKSRWRTPLRDKLGWIYDVTAWVVTFVLVCLLWIPFRCTEFSQTASYLEGLFVWRDGINWMHSMTLVLLSTLAVWHVMQLIGIRAATLLPASRVSEIMPMAAFVTLLLVVAMFAPVETSPFIYFQF
jgi:alginate O-acetyltransferase complex protein AlgI